MDTQTFQPSTLLQSLISCYWTLSIPADPAYQKQQILPDGHIEMVFILGDDIKRFTSHDTFILQPRAMVLGQITEPFFVLPTGNVESFAVRFFPYAFCNFSRLSMSDLANRETPLEEVFPKEQAEALYTKVTNATSTKDRIKIVEAFLLEKLSEAYTIDTIVKSTIDALMRSKGGGSIKSVLEEMPSQRRQLERKFKQLVGISPKQLGKIFRLQAALQMMLDRDEKLTAVAYDSNFYDQSHFNKDFKEFTGTNPKDFYDNDEFILSSLIYKK